MRLWLPSSKPATGRRGRISSRRGWEALRRVLPAPLAGGAQALEPRPSLQKLCQGRLGVSQKTRRHAMTDEPFIEPAEDVLHREGHRHQAHEAGDDQLAILPYETLAELPRH